MNLEKIKDFIRFISKSGVTDVSLETEDFKISISSPSRKKRNQEHIITKEDSQKITL